MRRLVGWFIFIGIAYLHYLVPPYFIGKVVDLLTYTAGENTASLLTAYCFGLTIVWIVAAIARLHARTALRVMAAHTSYRARVYGFERLMDQSIEWHDGESVGNHVERISAGSSALREQMNTLEQNILPNSIISLGFITAFFVYGFWLGVFGVLFLLVFFTIQTLFYRVHRRLLISHRAAAENATGTYVEGAGNVRTIKALHLETNFRNKVSSSEENARELTIQLDLLNHWKWRCFQSLNAAFQATLDPHSR